MKYPSVGHSPGALWRLLSISDYSLDELLVFDIDEPWSNSVNRWHEETIVHGRALTRGVHIPRNNFWLGLDHPWGNPHKQIKSYPPILCSKLHILPRQLEIADIDTLIAAYVFLRMRQSQSSNAVSQLDTDEPVTSCNRPRPIEPYGHQNHWHQYCFDERYLKHVVFSHAVSLGEVCTCCLPQDVTHDLASYLSRPTLAEFQADFRYTQRINPKNIIINQNRISDEEI